MAVNYDDERLTQVENDRDQALTENEQLYGGMIQESDSFYQAQIDAANDYAETQSKNQQEQTDFAIEQINQQKEQTHDDYLKEQTGAYVDWQKQSNQYGANAEQMAAAGLAKTGYSETSQVTMYNTYQNRVATAREAYVRAILNYDNAIKDAILQNNAALAEIAYQALQTQLTLSIEGFQYKNSLLIEKANKKMEIEGFYDQRFQRVLDQINTENDQAYRYASLAQDQAQFDARLAWEKEQYYAEQNNNTGKITGGGGGGGTNGDSGQISVDVRNTVSTPYYFGAKNPDCEKYGTFSNGYQPKGISGHGKLKDSGEVMTITTEVLYGDEKGKKKTLTQTVWKAEDGTRWYWDGRQNKYIRYSAEGGGGRSF